MSIYTKPLEHFMGVERYWENPEIEPSTLGPVPLPWEIRKFYFNPRSGKFRRAHQKWLLTKKNHDIIDQGFVGKQYVQSSDGFASHVNGSPILSFDDMVSVFDLAEKEAVPLGEAFLKMSETRPDWRVTDHFAERITEKGDKVYSQCTADAYNEMYGLGPSDPLGELKHLEEENRVLKARKQTKEIAAENEALRDEMISEQLKKFEAASGEDVSSPEADPADAVATQPRTRARRRIKKSID